MTNPVAHDSDPAEIIAAVLRSISDLTAAGELIGRLVAENEHLTLINAALRTAVDEVHLRMGMDMNELKADNERLVAERDAQVTSLQAANTEEVERRREAEWARDEAYKSFDVARREITQLRDGLSHITLQAQEAEARYTDRLAEMLATANSRIDALGLERNEWKARYDECDANRNEWSELADSRLTQVTALTAQIDRALKVAEQIAEESTTMAVNRLARDLLAALAKGKL